MSKLETLTGVITQRDEIDTHKTTSGVRTQRDGFATINEGCEFLHVSRTTFYGLMDDATIPFVMFRTVRRIPWAALYRLAGQ